MAIKPCIAKLILKAAQGQTIYKNLLTTARTKSRQLFLGDASATIGAEFSKAAACSRLATKPGAAGAKLCAPIPVKVPFGHATPNFQQSNLIRKIRRRRGELTFRSPGRDKWYVR